MNKENDFLTFSSRTKTSERRGNQKGVFLGLQKQNKKRKVIETNLNKGYLETDLTETIMESSFLRGNKKISNVTTAKKASNQNQVTFSLNLKQLKGMDKK